MRRYLQCEFLVPVVINLALLVPASAGTITMQVVDDKGSADVEGCDLRANLRSWEVQSGAKVTKKNNQED